MSTDVRGEQPDEPEPFGLGEVRNQLRVQSNPRPGYPGRSGTLMLVHFVLIDLVSQRDAVREHLRGVDIPTRLEWLQSWGTIREIDHRPTFRLTYVFESRLGLSAAFFFNDENDFVFLGDHFTFL